MCQAIFLRMYYLPDLQLLLELGQSLHLNTYSDGPVSETGVQIVPDIFNCKPYLFYSSVHLLCSCLL